MYLDDILLMAQSRNNLERQLEHIALLPEGLGFVVNRKKSHLHPIQSLQFLGFLVNSQEMSMKRKQPRWANLLSGKSIQPQEPDLAAATFAVKASAKDTRNAHILLKMDNSTAIFYANWMGGTHSTVLSNLAIHLWQWCLERIPPWGRKLRSWRGVKDNPVHCRMAAVSSYLPANHADPGHVWCGSVCDISQHPAGQVCELETESRGNRIRCTATDLDRLDGICLSPIFPNRELFQEGEGGQGIVDTDSTSMEIPAMVPHTAGTIDGVPMALPVDPALLMDPFSKPHPLMSTGQLQLAARKLSGVDSLQKEFQKRLQSCWPLDGAKGLTIPTRVPGSNGMAGVLNGVWIPFRALWSSF